MTAVTPSMGRGSAPHIGDVAGRILPRGELWWWAWASLLVFPSLLLAQARVIGLRAEHVGFCAVFLALSLMGARGRRYVVMGAPMWLTGAGYDFLRLVTHLRPAVHVDDLWAAERDLFGGIPDWIAVHTHPVLDAVTGAVYILYLPVPIALASILFLQHYEVARRLSVAFGLTSLLGWAIWLAWPAAPPWYVDQYGLGAPDIGVPPSAAGGLRFDALVGVGVFQSFYAHSHNVFGAMPSLHASYGLLPALATWPLRHHHPLLARGCAAWAAIMAYSAVYLRHHYILDVLAGFVVAALGYAVVRFVERGRPGHAAYGDSRLTEVPS